MLFVLSYIGFSIYSIFIPFKLLSLNFEEMNSFKTSPLYPITTISLSILFGIKASIVYSINVFPFTGTIHLVASFV